MNCVIKIFYYHYQISEPNLNSRNQTPLLLLSPCLGPSQKAQEGPEVRRRAQQEEEGAAEGQGGGGAGCQGGRVGAKVVVREGGRESQGCKSNAVQERFTPQILYAKNRRKCQACLFRLFPEETTGRA